MTHAHHPLLRRRDGHHARVTFEELFFDLVYVFAVTQVTHALLHHLDLHGLLQTLILWFAVWLGWQYTAWLTNWFYPEKPAIRTLLFAVMLAALVMAAAIPDAFGERALVFALAYVAIQFGKTLVVVLLLGRDARAANYRRMLAWLSVSGVLWLAGALLEEWRLPLWLVAVLCEYLSPMFGFRFPGLGRSDPRREWTVEGGHMAERCQLFVIVALGETLLATGAMMANANDWSLGVMSAMLTTFLGTLAMWWLYFGTSSKDATHTITTSDDPGRIASYYHYIHAIFVAGIIGTAVGNDLVVAHPHDKVKLAYAVTLTMGPAVYLLGSAAYKKVVYDQVPLSHIIGTAALLLLLPIGMAGDLLLLGWLTTGVMLGVCVWETRALIRRRRG
jgi:low temperature requirement protein LtrA